MKPAREMFVVVAPAAVVARFGALCEHAGLPFWARAVQGGPLPSIVGASPHDAPMTPLLLRVDQVAEMLGVSSTGVKRLLAQGDLVAVKPAGRARRVPYAAVVAYVERLTGDKPIVETQGAAS